MIPEIGWWGDGEVVKTAFMKRNQPLKISGNSFPGRENSMCKGPELEINLMSLRKRTISRALISLDKISREISLAAVENRL